MYYLR